LWAAISSRTFFSTGLILESERKQSPDEVAPHFR